MKDTGMNRKLDVLGRIVIPAEIRKSLGLKQGDRLDISLDEGRIVLDPAKDSCAFCAARAQLIQIGKKAVCPSCAGTIARELGQQELLRDAVPLRAAQ